MKNKSIQVLRVSMVLIAFTFYVGSVQAQSPSTKKPTEATSQKAENVKTIKVEVKGMSCQEGCANGLDATFRKTAGVITSKTSFDNSLAEITFDTSKITEIALVAMIEKRGFQAKLIDSPK